MNNINSILKEVLIKINPSKEELISIDKFLKNFITEFEKGLKREKINAQVFVGGSFAKKTLIKKGLYDIDVFVRFDEEYKGKEISDLTEKIIKNIKIKFSRIHGSRDYFKIDANPHFFIEVVPVIKVKRPKDAENITDLSYFHVNYLKKKLKGNMLNEIRLAKAFCHASKCYGAESYINGFSGYAVELLIVYYKNFLNFIKAMTKIKEKEIIDIEKLYKNKQEVIMNMNSAKITSPIILIDPTYKERNALAALSKETFERFKKACEKFIKNPSEEMFEVKKLDLEKIKNKEGAILINIETNKQEGDIAGSKLVKFYKHLTEEIKKFYTISNEGFEYHGKKDADLFFIVNNKKEIIFMGPNKKDKENIQKFKKRHKNIFIKGDRIYAKEKTDKKIKEFIKEWMSINSEKIKEMSINEIKILN